MSQNIVFFSKYTEYWLINLKQKPWIEAQEEIVYSSWKLNLDDTIYGLRRFNSPRLQARFASVVRKYSEFLPLSPTWGQLERKGTKKSENVLNHNARSWWRDHWKARQGEQKTKIIICFRRNNRKLSSYKGSTLKLTVNIQRETMNTILIFVNWEETTVTNQQKRHLPFDILWNSQSCLSRGTFCVGMNVELIVFELMDLK